MLGLLLIFKVIKVLMAIKITKMALVNMYLTIGDAKISVFLVIFQKFFTVISRRASLSIHCNDNERSNSTEAT